MINDPLVKAERLYKRRNWTAIIQVLEPLGSIHRESARYFCLLGTAYLHKDDIGSAYSCFRRAQSLDFRNIDISLGLAVVYIRRGESDKAVQLYIDVLDKFPKNAKAKNGLALIRKTKTLNIKAGKNLYPGPKSYMPIFAALAIITVILLSFAYFKIEKTINANKIVRDGSVDFVLTREESSNPVSSSGSFDIILTAAQAVESFNKAKSLFLDYRDEAALVELNRLLISNASRNIKTKALALVNYVREPSFVSMPDKFTYKQVSEMPKLYNGVGIIWKGLPANIVKSPKTGLTTFDLLVGYQNKAHLEGIAKVTVPFETRLDADRPIEVLGRIREAANNSFFVECIAIHEDAPAK